MNSNIAVHRASTITKSPSRQFTKCTTLSFTWLGHSTFLFRSPGGKRILTDPWVAGNPACPESSRKIGDLDLILISHGHSDHTGDAVAIARATGAHVIANYEICLWLEAKGIQNTAPMGHGGTRPSATCRSRW